MMRSNSYYRNMYGDASDEANNNMTRNSKKQRIRDKAAELLNRVKNQNYIQSAQNEGPDGDIS